MFTSNALPTNVWPNRREQAFKHLAQWRGGKILDMLEKHGTAHPKNDFDNIISKSLHMKSDVFFDALVVWSLETGNNHFLSRLLVLKMEEEAKTCALFDRGEYECWARERSYDLCFDAKSDEEIFKTIECVNLLTDEKAFWLQVMNVGFKAALKTGNTVWLKTVRKRLEIHSPETAFGTSAMARFDQDNHNRMLSNISFSLKNHGHKQKCLDEQARWATLFLQHHFSCDNIVLLKNKAHSPEHAQIVFAAFATGSAHLEDSKHFQDNQIVSFGNETLNIAPTTQHDRFALVKKQKKWSNDLTKHIATWISQQPHNKNTSTP